MHKPVLSAVFLCLLLAFGRTAYGQEELPGKLEELQARALAAQKKGDFRSAAENYREILKVRPHWPEAQADLGLMLHLMGDYQGAAGNFREALKVDPELFVANLFLGLDLIRLGNPRRAVRYLEKAEKLKPGYRQAVLGLGQAYADSGQLEGAESWYLRAVHDNPADAQAWRGLGATYLGLESQAAAQLAKSNAGSPFSQALLAEALAQQGQLADARRTYEKVIQSRPSIPIFLHAELGFVYVEENELASARSEFHKELQENPGCPLARLGLGSVGLRSESPTTSGDDLERLWEADPGFLKAHLFLLWLGKPPEQINGLEGAILKALGSAADPQLVAALRESAQAWRQGTTGILDWKLGSKEKGTLNGRDESSESWRTPMALFKEGRFSSCAEQLKAESPEPSPHRTHLLLPCAYYAGDYRTVFEYSGRLLRTAPREPEALFWRVKSSQKLGIAGLLKAGLVDPNDPNVHVLLADAFSEKQNTREAEKEYQRALQLDPANVRAHLGLARLYYKSLKFDRAIAELNKVLTSQPADPEANYILADILVYRHRYSEALPHLQTALHGPVSTLPNVHALLGKVYAFQGETKEAIAELTESLTADTDGSYHYQLYELYKKQGDLAKASAALEISERIRKMKAENEGAALRDVH